MKFGKKLSVAAFKALHNTERLDVITNPKTSKLFVATAEGSTVAAVSKNYKSSEPKEFVEMIMEDTGETIWCLRNPSSANVQESL